ncbi:MAG: hypothetical protein Ct9H300mP21_02440 [Pseudomonadota bacterium]|nr:MAG: hypothetical protein Ct9H300mP21_02440 [Pseudomonadota bacterium]
MLHRRIFSEQDGKFADDAMRDSQKTDIAFFPAWRYGATFMPGKITAEDVYNIVPTEVIFYIFYGRKRTKNCLKIFWLQWSIKILTQELAEI